MGTHLIDRWSAYDCEDGGVKLLYYVNGVKFWAKIYYKNVKP